MKTNKLTGVYQHKAISVRVRNITSAELEPDSRPDLPEKPATGVPDADTIEESRSLVPTADSVRKNPSSATTIRPSTSLVAQLLATHLGLPQTRARRRSGFASAVSAYEASNQTLTRNVLGAHINSAL